MIFYPFKSVMNSPIESSQKKEMSLASKIEKKKKKCVL